METKLTESQYRALRYIRAARPSSSCSAARAATIKVLQRLGLVHFVKSPVGTFCCHYEPTAAGDAYLTERRLANEAALRAHLALSAERASR